MAKYTVTYTCGHTVTHNIVGPEKGRPQKAEGLASKPCWECQKAEQAASAAEKTKDMVDLRGSDKQVAWATKIRADVVGKINRVAEGRTLTEKQRLVIDALYIQDEAKFWIDNRDLAGAQAWLGLAQELESTQKS